MTAAKATVVGLLPASVCLIGLKGLGVVGALFLGVPVLFVVGMTTWQVRREWYGPTATAPPPAQPDGPRGVLSQTEAAGRLNDLNTDLWERERDRWDS